MVFKSIMHTIARFKGTLYPDKSFSLGALPSSKKSAQDKRYDHAYEQQEPRDENAYLDYLDNKVTLDGQICSLRESPLLVKSPKSSQKKRGSYGSHGITNFGKRVCKNSAILLQKRHDRGCLGFGTATLPCISAPLCRYIIANIADISRRFYQRIRREYAKRGAEFDYIGVVEIQEKRFGDTNLPVPHLHFVFVAKPNIRSGYTLHTKDFYTAWNNSVNEVIGKGRFAPIMGVDGHVGSVKVEPIRKSAASYLGKYISKGCTVVKAMKEKGFTEFPKQWWTASMQCKKMFKDSLVHLRSDECEAIFYGLEHLLEEGLLTWCNFVDILIGDRYVRVGCVGVMSNDMYAIFTG